MKTEDLSKKFTQRYTLAIVLIALLSIGAFAILHVALKSSDATAFIVNLSGKQRMLSQRIASSAQHYHTLLLSAAPSTLEVHALKKRLRLLHDEMKEANTMLSSGAFSPTRIIPLSEQMHTLYFGATRLKTRVEEYLSLTQSLLNTNDPTQAHTILLTLLQTSETLLPDLHAAVEQYQKEGEAQIEKIKVLELGTLAVVLFTLLLEVIFIFQPMASHLKELFRHRAFQHHELEQQIKLRTLSLEEANAKLTHLAAHDQLTGLKNRLELHETLEKLMKHYQINHLPFGIALLDIDWFKQINDTYGHDVGDFTLAELATLLKSATREGDSIYRSGGEEFVIIFNRIKPEDLQKRVEMLRQRVEKQTFAFHEERFSITISIGLYHPDIIPLGSVREALKWADQALYEAKNQGRNRVVLAHA